MNQVMYAFLITTLAGLSTVIGSLLIFTKRKTTNIICCSLSFAAGVMVCVSLTDLLPEATNLLMEKLYYIPVILICLIFIVVGIILSMGIDKYLPDNKKDNQLYRVGIISMLAIILHNIPEGIATFMASNTNMKLGISLAIAIAFHNIPEGISISIPIYYSTNSRLKAFGYTFLSGMSELLGAIITYLFLSKFINPIFMGILFSMIAGIMIHISVYELIPTSLNYKSKKLTVIFFIIGVIFMFINHILFK